MTPTSREGLMAAPFPKLTELEAARADAAIIQRHTVEWLMSSEEAPDFAMVLAEIVNRPAWHRQAACRGADMDLFFLERGKKLSAEAVAYCESCQVRTQCLDSVLQQSQTVGVWGGTTARGRKRLRAQRGLA